MTGYEIALNDINAGRAVARGLIISIFAHQEADYSNRCLPWEGVGIYQKVDYLEGIEGPYSGWVRLREGQKLPC